MKKHNLLKVLGITFLVVIGLSWLIPTGVYSSGTFVKGELVPIGIIDLARLPIITFATFIQFGIVFLLIGALYGVINKTGVYNNLVEKVVTRWKGKENIFLIITIISFALLSALTSETILLFVLVPFFATILSLLGYKKIVSLLATVGSILVGNIGSICGFGIYGYASIIFGVSATKEIFTKIILFAILLYLFVNFVLKIVDGKKDKKEKKQKRIFSAEKIDEIPLYEKNEDKKKSVVPLVVIMIAFFVISAIGMFNWNYTFNVTFFTDIHNAIMEFTIKDYAIFQKLLGNITQLGYWGNYELAVALSFVIVLLIWIYNVKLEDAIDGFISGMKKMLPVAFYAILANFAFTFILNGTDGTILSTINNYIAGMADSFNVFTTSIASVINSFFYNDNYYLFSSVSSALATIETTILPVALILVVSIAGLVAMIAPTSLFLIAGLSFFDISFKEWVKSIWKYLVQALVVIIIVVIIIMMII